MAEKQARYFRWSILVSDGVPFLFFYLDGGLVQLVDEGAHLLDSPWYLDLQRGDDGIWALEAKAETLQLPGKV